MVADGLTDPAGASDGYEPAEGGYPRAVPGQYERAEDVIAHRTADLGEGVEWDLAALNEEFRQLTQKG